MDLYFPEGVPANVERILNPDVIFKKIRGGLRSLESDWKKLSPKANDISHGRRSWWKRLFGQTDVSPEWLHHYLYQNPSSWPVSAEDKRALLVLRRLRQMVSDRGSLLVTPEMKANPPTESEIKKALGFMAADTVPLLRQMERSYRVMLRDVGGEIEPLCEGVYGEPCVPGEGEEIVNADIYRFVKMGARGLSNPMRESLREWLVWSGI
jgi:hypothetical protein